MRCDHADLCQWGDDRPFQNEMRGPRVGSGIEETDEFPAWLDDRTDVAPFVAVAKGTSIRQVFGFCCSAMFQADNVIDLTADERGILMNQAIFAQIAGAFGNKHPQGCRDMPIHI